MSESIEKENSISIEENKINENEEDIDSANNMMDELTFGCSNSSFKTPQVNTINFDTNSNRKSLENEESDIHGINDEYKNMQSIKNILNNNEENNVNRVNTIKSSNNEDKINHINQSLKDLFIMNRIKNEINSIHSNKNDLSSFDSNMNFRNENQINQSLNNLIYGNKYKNDIISLNSNFTYNDTNNDTESINQSLINLVTHKNDIISIKSSDLRSKKENLNLQEMFDIFERKSKMMEINKKISKSGFIHIYDDNKNKKDNKENKHIQIIDEKVENEGEKIFIYKNRDIFNKSKKYNLPKKNVIDEAKYYEILLHNNKNINNKVHYSDFFHINKKK